jgi:circadian clock protein KaiC
MTAHIQDDRALAPRRLPTRIPGLDAVLEGGLLEGDSYLVIGDPGTGKTTLGNQLAFAHAASGRTAVYVTLLAESHERLMLHQRRFEFFDQEEVGRRVHYVSVLSALVENGLEGLGDAVRRLVRQFDATLLILDGMSAAEQEAESGYALGRLTHRLQTHLELMGCTTVLLSSGRTDEAGSTLTHVDGVIELFNVSADSQDVRELRVMKLRGSGYLSGRHEFTIDAAGMSVFPRLEAVYASRPAGELREERVSTGITGLDQLLNGGLFRQSSTMVLGTPGAGKTVLALHYLAAALENDEPALLATFQETQESVIATAQRIGLPLGESLDRGNFRVMWRSPLELSPDAWAWQLLQEVDAHQSRRVVIDTLSDLTRHFRYPERIPSFLQALTKALRSQGITTLLLLEIDVLVGSELVVPVPNVSAITDVGLVLRTVELDSELQRTLAIQKMRMSGFDGSLRHVKIDSSGMHVDEPFKSGPGALTGIPRQRQA